MGGLHIKPVWTALKRHKSGVILITLQIALTLAIVCNALFIIRQRIAQAAQPTGIDEADTLIVSNQWIGKLAPAQIGALVAADLTALRRMPGVVDAYAGNAYPLGGNGTRVMGLSYRPEQTEASISATTYLVDDHALATLDLTLAEGRNFRADELDELGDNDKLEPPAVIVSKALAKRLFPDASALGKQIYMGTRPSRIVGVVERLQWSFGGSAPAAQMELSLLAPVRPLSMSGYYVVRTRPGQRDAVAARLAGALYAIHGKRVIEKQGGVRSFAEIRRANYAADTGMAILMGIVSAMLLAVTAAGIVGLTSFWVGQRRKQIGVRRALGATRGDILAYFVTENLLISAGGAALGLVLALALNLWLALHFEMERISAAYLLAGVLIVLALGQAAVLVPARRAAGVPPVVATRTV